MISPLLTDLYQFTMAYGYWKLGLHEREAVFQMTFRNTPFKGNYAVACGLDAVIEFIRDWRVTGEDLDYLAGLCTAEGKVLFSADFLAYLSQLRMTCDVDAMPEGSLVFPHEPLIRITGPLIQGQLLESTILNSVNFQTLIATKSARICQAAQGDSVLEFGLRRAQGPDGALSASRAAYIGGCVATSNVLAGKQYGIPVRGTHAHSWVTAFPDEMQAFAAYAQVMPHNCILLVDTYDTLQGVAKAIEVGKQLRAQGSDLLGIRLDSGDLADLSIKARELLDAAGFEQTAIVASNALDEYVIQELKAKKARISIWGVGTSLVTAYDHAALDGVYKLSALRDENGVWDYKLKLSEQAVKVTNPGIYQVRRFYQKDRQIMDVLYDVERGIPEHTEVCLLDESGSVQALPSYDASIDLLQSVFKKGVLIYPPKTIQETRDWAMQEVKTFVATQGGAVYPVGLEKSVYELKQKLIDEMIAKK